MRLFVAIDIDEQTRAQLASVRAAVQAVLDQSSIPPRVTWVKDESAHVTLRFIGNTSEAVAIQIQEALMKRWPVAPFDVRWEQIGAFPGGRRPRVVWIGPGSANQVATLARLVNERLDPLIGPGETRPFTPHLTLGRVKESGVGVDWARALGAAAWVPTTTRVDHVTLYSSRLSPKGPTYTALCKAPL